MENRPRDCHVTRTGQGCCGAVHGDPWRSWRRFRGGRPGRPGLRRGQLPRRCCCWSSAAVSASGAEGGGHACRGTHGGGVGAVERERGSPERRSGWGLPVVGIAVQRPGAEAHPPGPPAAGLVRRAGHRWPTRVGSAPSPTFRLVAVAGRLVSKSRLQFASPRVGPASLAVGRNKRNDTANMFSKQKLGVLEPRPSPAQLLASRVLMARWPGPLCLSQRRGVDGNGSLSGMLLGKVAMTGIATVSA